MRCRDFERLWNERLDARADGSPEADREMEAHAASCRSCQSWAGRYRVLRQAIVAQGPPPVPPAEFPARCLDEWARTRPSYAPRTIGFRPPVRWAAAAVLLVMAGLIARSWFSRPQRAAPPIAQHAPEAPPAPTRFLADALADATAATLDLALQASAPAARVGREVLGDVSVPAASTPVLLTVPVGPAPQTWQSVGDRVGAGFHPLSGSARHAFGFLLAPALDAQDAAPGPETGA
jgi:predicted anti-sigma-YlaC factor YlaD